MEEKNNRGKKKIQVEVALVYEIISISPCKKFSASIKEDQGIRIYDKKTGEVIHQLKVRDDTAQSVKWSPDSKFLISLSKGNRTIQVWDASTGKELKSYEWWGRGITCNVSWSPNIQYFVVDNGQDTYRLWDITTGKEIKVFQDIEEQIKKDDIEEKRFKRYLRVESFSWSPDSKNLTVVGNDGYTRVWSVNPIKQLQRFKSKKGS